MWQYLNIKSLMPEIIGSRLGLRYASGGVTAITSNVRGIKVELAPHWQL